jgi:hypothetical protein
VVGLKRLLAARCSAGSFQWVGRTTEFIALNLE